MANSIEMKHIFAGIMIWRKAMANANGNRPHVDERTHGHRHQITLLWWKASIHTRVSQAISIKRSPRWRCLAKKKEIARRNCRKVYAKLTNWHTFWLTVEIERGMGEKSFLAIICPVIRNNCVDDVSVSDRNRKRGEQLRTTIFRIFVWSAFRPWLQNWLVARTVRFENIS